MLNIPACVYVTNTNIMVKDYIFKVSCRLYMYFRKKCFLLCFSFVSFGFDEMSEAVCETGTSPAEKVE